MKIKDVQLSILRTELDETVIPTQGAVDKLPQLVLVSVSTDEGIDGHYVSYLIPAKSVEHAAEVAKTILVGRDTYDVGALSHEMTNALPPYSNPPALAAADACLWDINAKAAGLPLYKYLGAQREKIRAYASTVAYSTIDGLPRRDPRCCCRGIHCGEVSPVPGGRTRHRAGAGDTPRVPAHRPHDRPGMCVHRARGVGRGPSSR